MKYRYGKNLTSVEVHLSFGMNNLNTFTRAAEDATGIYRVEFASPMPDTEACANAMALVTASLDVELPNGFYINVKTLKGDLLSDEHRVGIVDNDPRSTVTKRTENLTFSVIGIECQVDLTSEQWAVLTDCELDSDEIAKPLLDMGARNIDWYTASIFFNCVNNEKAEEITRWLQDRLVIDIHGATATQKI